MFLHGRFKGVLLKEVTKSITGSLGPVVYRVRRILER